MLAKLARMPIRQEDYFFEFKWDGIRALFFLDGKGPRLQSRNLKDLTKAFPEVIKAGTDLKESDLILDGEIIAFDDEGKPSFGALQHRMHVGNELEAARRAVLVPATYMVFDLLYFRGESLINRPLFERREILESIQLPEEHWNLSAAYNGEGSKLLAATKKAELEGLIAKRMDSIYRPGARPGDWIKIKLVQSDEFLIGGWTDETSGRSNMLGAILLGYYSGGARKLKFIGKTGTGFTEKSKADLTKRLQRIETKTSPFAGVLPKGKYHFAQPELIAEIEFRGWTADGKLRQSAYKGLRIDKKPAEITGPEEMQ